MTWFYEFTVNGYGGYARGDNQLCPFLAESGWGKPNSRKGTNLFMLSSYKFIHDTNIIGLTFLFFLPKIQFLSMELAAASCSNNLNLETEFFKKAQVLFNTLSNLFLE